MIRQRWIWVSGLLLASAGYAEDVTSAGPNSVTLSLYDTDFALVNETRSVPLRQGVNRLLFRGMPANADPSSFSFVPTPRLRDLRIVEQQFEYDTDKWRLISTIIYRPDQEQIEIVREQERSQEREGGDG